MYNHKRFVALIPARKGSKGIPHKNVALCAGKPLICWTFEAALSCPLLDAIYCSSDDPEALQLAKAHQITCIKRPAILATDASPMLDTILHAKRYWQATHQHFDYVVLLQPTSPLRTAQDIRKGIKQITEDKTNSLASVHAMPLRAGLFVQGRWEGSSLRTQTLFKKWADLQRQQATALYYINGALYIWKIDCIKPNFSLNSPQSAVILPKNHTQDIDTLKDFRQCELLLRQRGLRKA